MDLFLLFVFVYVILSCLVVTCWERADLLALLCVVFSCVLCRILIQCPASGVVLDCTDS